MTPEWTERTVFVTGASRGIGAAVARAFGRRGATVWVGYRARGDDAAAVAAAVEQLGGRARSVQLDVRIAGDVERAFDTIRADGGGLDVLVNNAGVTSDGYFAVSDEGAWKDVLETNLLGVMRCCRAAVPHMWRSRKGAIVNVASVSGPIANPGQSSYAASKAGLLGFTRTLAAELAPRGVRVNAVVPGLIDAGMTERIDRRHVEQKSARIPAGRLGTGEEVAEAVVFLASDAASYVIGQELFVDGGLCL